MKRVLISYSPFQTAIALMENGELIELQYTSSRRTSLVGNIYLGRVEAVQPNLQAAFVQIGTEKNAYFYYGNHRAASDTEKNERRPKVGDTILVQVTKDAAGLKGAVVTDQISLIGRFLVLLPNEPGEIGISAKIQQNEERKRIHRIMEEILPSEYGVVVRTNGQGKDKEAYIEELTALLEKKKILDYAAYQKAPVLVLGEDRPWAIAVRDFFSPDLDEFVVDNRKIYQEMQHMGYFDGEGQPKLVLHQEKIPLFDSYFIESKRKKALDRKVWLKSGGFLIIEQTEALAVIDVNTGKSAGKGDLEKHNLKINLEAAKEAAAQIRLRNLSGIIIIDFIDMVDKENQLRLRRQLEDAVRKDRIKTMVVGATELGLMQLTRKKVSPPLEEQICCSCPICEGTGKKYSIDYLTGEIYREILRLFQSTIYDEILLEGERGLLCAFQKKMSEMEAEFAKYGSVYIQESEFAAYGEYKLAGKKKSKNC